MDERLERALAFGNYRITIENRRKAIVRRFENMLTVYHHNGMFVANQETIAFVDTLIRQNHKDAILLDSKNNPIEIDDLVAFRDVLFDAYFAATNEYLTEVRKLKKARDVKKAMDW